MFLSRAGFPSSCSTESLFPNLQHPTTTPQTTQTDTGPDLANSANQSPIMTSLTIPQSGSSSIVSSTSQTSIGSSSNTPKKKAVGASPKKSKLGAGTKATPFKTAKAAAPFIPSNTTTAEASSKQNVVVCVRMRPAKEDASADESIWFLDQDQNQIIPTENHPSLAKRAGSSSTAGSSLPASTSAVDLDDEASATYKFQFDKLLTGTNKTDDMYDSHISPVVQAAMEGYNGTVFAYGQTGSGKTYTMSGSDDEPGVIPRAVQQVFKTIEQVPDREFLLRVSYLEIYNETLKDLLAPLASTGGSTSHTTESSRPASPTKGGSSHQSSGSSLRIVEDQKNARVMITGLREEIVTDPTTVLDLIQKGQEARHVNATDWNERSSRSHCVFQVTIESRAKLEGGKGKEVRISQLNLIDLAGSERAASQAERRKEGAFINKSLLTLGTVIAKLTESPSSSAAGSDQHIPYRDSKLTRILQTSLSGNARIAVICTLSPDVKHAVETLSTLKFGKRCKMVITTAKKGTSMDDKALLQKYRRELDALRAKLEAGGSTPKPEDDEETLASSRESKEKLAQLNQEKQKAEKEVEEMHRKRGDLKGQIEHLTRLILTSQNVAKERRALSSTHGENSFEGTPRKTGCGGIERRGPRMSDIHSFAPSPDVSDTPTLSGSKPFELEAELAALRRQLRQQVESRQALVTAHQAELAARDAKEVELAEAIRMNEEELDEAEVAYDRLKVERDEARQVALKEQEKAREHKKMWSEEKEANRLLKLVAKSRGAEEDDALRQEVEKVKQQMAGKEKELKVAQEQLEAAKKEKAKQATVSDDDDDAQKEFKDLISSGSQAQVLKQKEEALVKKEQELEKLQTDLDAQRAHLEKKSIRPLPVPSQPAKEFSALQAKAKLFEEQNADLQSQLSSLREDAAEVDSLRSEASKLSNIQMQLSGTQVQITRLERQLEEEKAKAAKPLPVPTFDGHKSVPGNLFKPSGLATGSVPSSPLKGFGVSRLRTGSVVDAELPSRGLNRGGSVREYRRYKPEEDVKASQEEIDRLNAVITSQRAIMSDLEKSVASWRNRLKAQADLIAKLAGASTTPPMQEYELSPSKRSSVFESPRSRLMDSPEPKFSTLPRSAALSNLASKEPYYGAHTYNRPPSTIGLGVLLGSPPKSSHGWTNSSPNPLPPPPCSPSPKKRKPRMTIENELLALKSSPRVETSKNAFSTREKEGDTGLRNRTNAAVYYI